MCGIVRLAKGYIEAWYLYCMVCVVIPGELRNILKDAAVRSHA